MYYINQQLTQLQVYLRRAKSIQRQCVKCQPELPPFHWVDDDDNDMIMVIMIWKFKYDKQVCSLFYLPWIGSTQLCPNLLLKLLKLLMLKLTFAWHPLFTHLTDSHWLNKLRLSVSPLGSLSTAVVIFQPISTLVAWEYPRWLLKLETFHKCISDF